MLRDGVGDRGGQAFAQGVVAAHDALKLGELSHHAGDQIGLGEPGGQPRLIGIGAGDEGRQFSRQRLHPGNFFGDRAELGVEGDGIERRDALFQLHLAVLVPEELGVRQAGAQDALVAGDDGGAAVRGGRVGDHDEAGGEFAGGVGRGEVFLVRPHGGGQHLRRHVHELLIDGAAQHDRPFDKAGDLVQQSFVGGDDKAVAAGDFRRVGGDLGAALVAGQDDMGFAQPVAVRVEVAGGDDGIGGEKTMPPCSVDKCNQSDFSAEVERAFQQLPVEDGKDVMDRPDPAESAGRPAHALGPGELPDRLVDQVGQHVGGIAAGLFGHGEPEDALAGVALFALLQAGEAGAAQEAGDRLFGRADAGAFALFLHVRRAGGQTFDHQRQTARGGVGLRRSDLQAGCRQLCGDQALEILGRTGLHACRNILGEQFDQKLGHDIRRVNQG